MKELFERLDRYGTGWILSFRVGATNNIMIVLEYLDPKTVKMHQEAFMLSRKAVEGIQDGDTEIINVLDTLYGRIMKKV